MHSITISSISAATYDYQLTNLFFLIYFQLSTLSILKKNSFFPSQISTFSSHFQTKIWDFKIFPSFVQNHWYHHTYSCFIYHSNHFIIIKPCLLSGLPDDIIIIFLNYNKRKGLRILLSFSPVCARCALFVREDMFWIVVLSLSCTWLFLTP